MSRSATPTRSALGLVLLALLVSAALGAEGCRTRRDPCGDPVVVAQTFLEALEAGDGAAALRFVSRAARQDLERQATEASATLGQKLGPGDLLVPERSVLARADWLVLRSTQGDEAWLDVRPPADAGALGQGPWSAQRMVREDGCWKVDLFHEGGLPLAPSPSFLDAAAPDGGS
jgi:hypothetical protein